MEGRLSDGIRFELASGEARLGEDDADGRPRVSSAGNARRGRDGLRWGTPESEEGGARDFREPLVSLAGGKSERVDCVRECLIPLFGLGNPDSSLSSGETGVMLCTSGLLLTRLTLGWRGIRGEDWMTVSIGCVDERDIERGEAMMVDEPEDERDSGLNGSVNVGVSGSARLMAVTSRLRFEIFEESPLTILVLLGRPSPRPTPETSVSADFPHWLLERLCRGVGWGDSSGDSTMADKCRDEGLCGTVRPGVEVVEPDTRRVASAASAGRRAYRCLSGPFGVIGWEREKGISGRRTRWSSSRRTRGWAGTAGIQRTTRRNGRMRRRRGPARIVRGGGKSRGTRCTSY